MKKKWVTLMGLVLAGSVLLASMAGCSEDGTGAGSASANPASGAAMEEVARGLEDVSGKPPFYAEKFGKVDAAAALKDKKIMLVAYDSTNDWCVNYVKMANQVYAAVGAKPFITYCDGKADSWISAVQSAINQKYDAVDLFGISDIGQLDGVIAEARKAGVYVQDTHGTDISTPAGSTDASVGCDYTKAGEMMALETIREVGDPAKVNCLVVADVGWGADSSVRKGVEDALQKYGCKYTMADVSITDWTEGIGNAVRNAFIADESYNAVIAFYDNMCLYVVPALEQLGVDLNNVVVGSFNGNPALVDYVSAGQMDFNLGESIGWCACHAVDCMARAFAKQEVHNDAGFAMYLITQENVKDYVDPAVGKAAYAYDGVQDIYLPGYSELWGVDLAGVFDNIS